MTNVWGNQLKISIFGESHGPAIGITIDGLAPGFTLDLEKIKEAMARRAPGQSDLTSPRREKDNWEILSGFWQGKTTGSPLCAVIANQDTRSRDYQPHLLRPGHADYTAWIKYKGFADYRGGGHFSGRLTACLVFAGAIAQQCLAKEGIVVGGRIASIYDINDGPVIPEHLQSCAFKDFPVMDDKAGQKMQEAILQAKNEGDSCGGTVECWALNVPPGLGEPFFGSLESSIASLAFAIPGIKGIEFGRGFALTAMKGSQANDPLRIENDQISFTTNHNGGINGGISNGSPLIVRLAVKPTPTISKSQKTVNIQSMTNEEVSFGGRHDPCIVPRALPVAISCLSLCLLDQLMTASYRESFN